MYEPCTIKREEVISGVKISCFVSDKRCKQATIEIEHGTVFVCQDEIEGDRCVNKHGHRFSWSVGPASGLKRNLDEFFDRTNVRSVKTIVREWDTKINGGK